LAFWILIALGFIMGTLSRKGVGIFALCWLAGYVALPRIAWWTGPLVTSWVAVLDIVLVFVVLRGDVHLT
jgi:hypothetical protein